MSKYLTFALTISYLYRVVNVASIWHCKPVRIKVMCMYWRIKNLRVIILWKLSISDSYLFKCTFINIPIYAYLIRAKVSWIQYARIEFIVRVYLITHVQIIALFNFKFQVIYKIWENRNFILLQTDKVEKNEEIIRNFYETINTHDIIETIQISKY